MKKITKRMLQDLNDKIQSEGGLQGFIEWGGIPEEVVDTELEAPFTAFVKSYDHLAERLEYLLDLNGIETE